MEDIDIMFEDIGQTDADLVIDSDINFDIEGIIDITKDKYFQYPAILVSGVKFNDALRVLKTIRTESYRLFDVWIDLGDGTQPVKQGRLPANSDFLLVAKYLGLTITLYLNKDTVRTLDLNDTSVIEEFI